jgi:hypothetical protein
LKGGGRSDANMRIRGLQYRAAVKFDSKFNFQSDSNYIQICSNFDRSKKEFPELEQFEIKYGCEGFEERNNFLHSNFYRFEMDVELKIWEFKV